MAAFWKRQAKTGGADPVAPRDVDRVLLELRREPLPEEPASLDAALGLVSGLLDDHIVKTSHPLFLGYVTPPALALGAAGDAMAAIINQNVSFAALSPIGSALESIVVGWLADIIGFADNAGGVLTSGGSEANLYALSVARRKLLGPAAIIDGNRAEPDRRLRVYCSDQTHHSIDKAAIMLGLGTNGVRRIPVDAHHRVRVDLLNAAIEEDQAGGQWRPMAIVANAGSRLCCAVDDIDGLRALADRHNLWLHADGAYGAFLRLASRSPENLSALGKADSVTIDPHKLLFVPFDCGSLIVREARRLTDCFGGEGEYLEPSTPPGLNDFANLGMQLGRSMKALKVWLVIKRLGAKALGEEYDRLIDLADYFADLVRSDDSLELLGPTGGTAVCFRWKGDGRLGEVDLRTRNSHIREQLIRSGAAFIDEVDVDGRRGFRVCMTNFRTTSKHLDRLLGVIGKLAQRNTSPRG
ncbi:MAG TPA: pyridoxal-dependent decarboxylase [Planctomycetota bacterium]|nr:pyridoxal-dependent decarboxylase [Planctomycetota bacterium]